MQWDECLNLDSILEEVLQQLIIPGLRSSIVGLCMAEQTENVESDLKKNAMTGNDKLFEEVENVLTALLPNNFQAFLSTYSSNNKDAFSNTIKELENFVHLEKSTNKLETKSSTSPLEEITFLPNIVASILKEVSLGKTRNRGHVHINVMLQKENQI